MKKGLYVYTILYFVGLLTFLATGICELNGVFYIAIIMGIVGLVYTVQRSSKQ